MVGCDLCPCRYDITDTMSVPSNKVGLVMGKGGETIRNICSQSGAHCQVLLSDITPRCSIHSIVFIRVYYPLSSNVFFFPYPIS